MSPEEESGSAPEWSGGGDRAARRGGRRGRRRRRRRRSEHPGQTSNGIEKMREKGEEEMFSGLLWPLHIHLLPLPEKGIITLPSRVMSLEGREKEKGPFLPLFPFLSPAPSPSLSLSSNLFCQTRSLCHELISHPSGTPPSPFTFPSLANYTHHSSPEPETAKLGNVADVVSSTSLSLS